MAYPARQLMTFKEYLVVEEMSDVRHEYLDGMAWAMAGGTIDRSAICTNVLGLLSFQLRGKKGRLLESNFRIRVKATGLGTYPDASVFCDRVQLDPADAKRTTANNPTLVVEVLSPSTEKYDRGEKLEHYKKIPSLKEIVLVHQSKQLVEVWRRTGARWSHHQYDDVAELASINCTLPLIDVYRDMPD
jgi:Uma2 family endonuclease